MKNLWSGRQAQRYVRRYARAGVNADLALRVYTTRLLGGEPRLVLHGGGNTSVKTTLADVAGDMVEVLCVKGSGWDMGAIEPEGLPAVRLDALRRLMALPALADEDMVKAQRAALLDADAPGPSIETLLHAFLPHKFIDHTHANAILALTDQRDGAKLCRAVFGGRVAYVPYAKPGFALAKKAYRVHRRNPDVEGMVFLKHGVFTFGATAKEAYGRMIALVTLAERRLGRARRKVFAARPLPKRSAAVAEVAPILRGLACIGDGGETARRRFILEFRGGPATRRFVGGRGLARYGGRGPATPDHVIRTKARPLIVPPPAAGGLDDFARAARRAFAAYQARYRAYFRRHNARQETPKTELDPMPRVVLVPGVGLFALGPSAREARIAADLAEATIEVATAAEAVGTYAAISERHFFDIEYWSLEQAKLGRSGGKPLARHVVAVTGGASGIGRATAEAFAAAGAEVAILDIDGAKAARAAAALGGLGIGCDVTDGRAVGGAFDRVCEAFGGVDIVVSNAGSAWQGRIGEVADDVLRRSFELNFFAHQRVAQNAVRVMRAQGTGGCLLFNASKQAVNPGRDFGPYGIPKAATLFLMRQYALDHGADGIRACAVNADRVRSGLLTGTMVKSRARARGVGEKDYMSGNLLGREVTAQDVARAFVDLALAEKTTAAVVTVDGGNIAAALR